MDKKKKCVRRQLAVWVFAACVLTGTIFAGAAEDILWEEPEKEPGSVQEVETVFAGTAEDILREEPEFGLLDVEDLGSLTAEELSLLTGPDDPAAAETAQLSVREAQAAEASAYASPEMSEKFSEIYNKAGSYLYGTVTNPVINSIGGDWAVFGLARAGYPAGNAYYAKYAKNVSDEVTRVGGVLSDVKYTEYSRVILGLTAAGYDAGNVAGYDLLAPLADLEKVVWQGINGPIWALIALDSRGCEVRQAPTGKTQATRRNLIGAILEGQLDDGGWSIAGFSADPDMTAMAIMALTPYYKDGSTWTVYGQSVTVRQAVDRALETLSSIQDASGGYISYREPNSESCAQVLTALSEFGIDPEKDTRFQKNGRSVLDALLSYADSSGGFCHTPGTEVNGMSCEQAYYALAAYSRYLNGQKRLYDMTDVASLKAVPKPEDFVLDLEPEPEDNPGSPGESGNDSPEEKPEEKPEKKPEEKPAKKPVKKVKLNKKKATLKKGKTLTLKAVLTPQNASEKVTWSSSNKKVAKVNKKGKVTARKKGTAVITVKTASGKKATCKITVK